MWPELFHPFGTPQPVLPTTDELQGSAGLLGQVLSEGIAHFGTLNQSAALAPWERRLLVSEQQVLSCLPLVVNGIVYGAFEVAHPVDQPGSEPTTQLLEATATLIALAVARLLPPAKSEQRTHHTAVFQQAREALLLIDPNTLRIAEANVAASVLIGLPAESLADLPIDQLVAFGVPNWQENKLQTLLSDEQIDIDGLVRTGDGQAIQVFVVVSEIMLDHEHYLLLMLRDARQRQKMIRQLLQAERLACMGRMVETIAHEINNPLQAISNSLHLLINRPISEDKRERYLTLTQREVERLTGIVQQILDFHRPYRDGMRPVSIHALLEQVLTATAPSFAHNSVALERDWAERLPWVIGIGSHLRYVFQNLIGNAIDAMPTGGKLIVRTRVETLRHSTAAQAVVIEVIDTGPGVSDSEAQFIFEPFYTTKSDSTGMGLPISYNIIRQHGGKLSVSSSGGATFRITLPPAGTDAPLE